VIASPILTRVYAPADFGVYGAALSLITFLTVASSLRYERAIPLPDDESVAASLVAACLLLVVVTTILGGVVLIAIGPEIAAFLRAPSLVPILWVVVLAQVGAGAYQVMNAWAVRARSYSEIARTRVSQSIVTLAVQLGLGGFGLVSGGLVIGDAVGRSVGTGPLAVRLWRSNSRAVRSVTLAGIKDALVRFRRFGLLVAPASLLNSVSLQIPSIMLLALYGPTVGGWYLLVQRMGAIPASLVSVSVGQVFLGEAARVAREEPSRLPTLFRKTWRSLVAIGAGPMVALAVLGPIVTPIVFGETWRDAGPYLTILAPMLFLQFAIEPVTAILVVLERQGVVIVGELIRAGLMVSIWLVAADRHLTPLATVGLISVAGSASYLMYFVVSRRAAQRKESYRRRERLGSDWGG
jgi:O-antigen/teichoic acid export membrane protein